MTGNATFTCFKLSGKFYAQERGNITPTVYQVFQGRKEAVLQENDGKWPGLSGRGDHFICVVDPDDDLTFGFPLLFHPTQGN